MFSIQYAQPLVITLLLVCSSCENCKNPASDTSRNPERPKITTPLNQEPEDTIEPELEELQPNVQPSNTGTSSPHSTPITDEMIKEAGDKGYDILKNQLEDLKNGIKIAINKTTDTRAETALSQAIRLGNPNLVKVLIEAEVDVNQKNAGTTPLILAVAEGNIEIVKILLKAEANKEAKDSKGMTLLHTATAHGRVEVAALLINKKAGLNIPDTDGNTPLHYAARTPYTKMVELLIQAGADVHITNKANQTPLTVALAHPLQVTSIINSLSKASSPNG